MNTDYKKPSVYGTMRAVLNYLNSPQEQKNLAGNLAAIRSSIGKNGEEATEVWSILFPLMPEEFLGSGSLSYEERALMVALQLYAVGQQGSNKMINSERSSFGSSLRHIRGRESTSLDRRFNAMLTSASFDEFVYHLRQLFMVARSDNAFAVDFSILAEDLFRYQNRQSKRICLNWARDYYKKSGNDETQKGE